MSVVSGAHGRLQWFGRVSQGTCGHHSGPCRPSACSQRIGHRPPKDVLSQSNPQGTGGHGATPTPLTMTALRRLCLHHSRRQCTRRPIRRQQSGRPPAPVGTGGRPKHPTELNSVRTHTHPQGPDGAVHTTDRLSGPRRGHARSPDWALRTPAQDPAKGDAVTRANPHPSPLFHTAGP